MGLGPGAHAQRVWPRVRGSATGGRLRGAALALSSVGRLPWALAVAFAAVLVRLPLLFDESPAVQPDGYGYLSIADDLLAGDGFSPRSLYRPPGYPLLIAVADLALPGRTEQAVIIAQHLIGAALAVVVLLVAWRCFGKLPAIVAAVLALVSPQMVALEHEVLSDFLFMVVVVAGIAALALAVQEEEPALRRLAVVGALFGAATLVKPLGQVLVVLVPIVLVLLARRRAYALRGSLVATLAMAAVVVPWIAHNYIRFDRATISTIGDQTLFWRTFDGSHALPFAGEDPQTRWVRRQYERAAAGGPPASVWLIHAKLMKKGYSAETAGRLEKDIALRAIRASPRLYAKGTAVETRQFHLRAGPVDGYPMRDRLVPARERALDSAPAPISEGVARLSVAALAGAPKLLQIWWTLSFSALAGLLLLFLRDRARRAAALTLIAGWLVLAGATALTALSDPRYSLVGMPLLWITGSAGAVLVLGAAWRAVRRTGERST